MGLFAESLKKLDKICVQFISKAMVLTMLGAVEEGNVLKVIDFVNTHGRRVTGACIYKAIEKGHADMLTFLASTGQFVVNGSYNRGQLLTDNIDLAESIDSPLTHATSAPKNNLELVQVLMQNGAKVQPRDLYHAICGNKGDVLEYFILSGADLSNANLSNTNLSNANLVEVKLTNPNLTNSRLTGTDLSYSDCIEADLAETDFVGSNIIGANFVRANLAQARFGDVNFNECLLTDANLYKTKFFGVESLTSMQIKAAKNWSEGIYDAKLLAKFNSAN